MHLIHINNIDEVGRLFLHNYPTFVVKLCRQHEMAAPLQGQVTTYTFEQYVQNINDTSKIACFSTADNDSNFKKDS